MRDSLLWLVSLARKAGKVEAGAFLTERAVKSGRAVIVILAADASENTKEKVINNCAYYETEVFEYADKAKLAQFTGKQNVSVLAICDENFANGIKSKLQ